MKIKKNSKQGMGKKEIAEFIEHYEKITKWMLKVLPIKADLTVPCVPTTIKAGVSICPR